MAIPLINTLTNKLHLVTIERPHTPTVAVRVYVRAGSRYDGELQIPTPPLGLAHFVEHMLFQKSGSSGRNALLAEVERSGGLLEAETTKEYTRFTVITTPPELAIALRVLAELLRPRSLTQSRFIAEKLTIAQEQAQHQDRHSIIFDHFADLMWPTHPLQNPILGTPAGLAAITPALVDDFFSERYVTGNMVLVVCGTIDADETIRLAEQYFSGVTQGLVHPPIPIDLPTIDQPRFKHIPRNMGQSYLMVGVPTVGMKHSDRSALKIIERILGMGASGRLYQRLRQNDSLVYNIRTVTAQYEDAGYFAVSTACAPDHVDQVLHAIVEEWEKISQSAIMLEELEAARRNYAGTLARNFETNAAVAGITGVEQLLHRPECMADAIARINQVSRDDVLKAAQKYLNHSTVAVVIGRSEGEHD